MSDVGLDVRSPEEHHYLNQSGTTTVEGLSDEKEFEEMLEAMDTCNIVGDERASVFRILAAILVKFFVLLC